VISFGWLQSAITTTNVLSTNVVPMFCQLYSSSLSTRFLCALLTFDIWTSSSPPRLPCAKFRFCSTLHYLANPCRKNGYSVTHSPSLFDTMGTRTFRFGTEQSTPWFGMPSTTYGQNTECALFWQCRSPHGVQVSEMTYYVLSWR